MSDAGRDGFVYYMQCADTLRIKIGWSKDPERRLAQIRSGGPTLIELVATEPGRVDIEAARHHEFSAARVPHIPGREWFYPVPALVELLTHLGGEPRTGPVVPEAVLERCDGKCPEPPRVMVDDRRHVEEIEGLVQDLLLLRDEKWWSRKGYRHGYLTLSRVLLSDIRFLRAWLRPAVESVRRHGARQPEDLTRDPLYVLPARSA